MIYPLADESKITSVRKGILFFLTINFFINIKFSYQMEKLKNEVVKDVTTVKKKYVKPDFEVIELNMDAPLLSASGSIEPNGKASFSNNGLLGTSSWGSND